MSLLIVKYQPISEDPSNYKQCPSNYLNIDLVEPRLNHFKYMDYWVSSIGMIPRSYGILK